MSLVSDLEKCCALGVFCEVGYINAEVFDNSYNYMISELVVMFGLSVRGFVPRFGRFAFVLRSNVLLTATRGTTDD